MLGTFEVRFPPRQKEALEQIETFLGVKFTNRNEDLGCITIRTYSEGLADEIERIKNKIRPLDITA